MARANGHSDPIRLCMIGAACLAAAACIGAIATLGLRGVFAGLTAGLFWMQDVPALACGALCLKLGAVLAKAARPIGWSEILARHPAITVLAAGTLAVGIAASGGFFVFHGFAMSRDEIMANFDADILATGHLIMPVAPQWRPFIHALSPTYLLPVPAEAGWVSEYLPGNAAFRALVGLITSRIWAGPILIAVSCAAMFALARRLWPAQPGARLAAMLLLCASPQLLVTGMTSYAMNILLAVNLVWLWLFLRDDRRSHAAAMGVGFLGCGLHQLIFHPLFVAPFLLQLRQRGRLGLLLCYLCAYGVSIAFWIYYPTLVATSSAAPPDDALRMGGLYFLFRIYSLLADFGLAGAAPMAVNLARFLSWEHILALPLALLAWGSIRREEGIARPLADGIVLTCAAMFVLLPYQGNGWGYRYLHGLIGSFCLLGGYGWLTLVHGANARRQAACIGTLAFTTLATLCVILPLQLAKTSAFITPYRRALAAIEAADADIVLVDRSGLQFAEDLARNDPLLRNRPMILSLAMLEDPQLAALCAKYRVAVFDRTQGIRLGMQQSEIAPAEEARTAAQRAIMAGLRCGTPLGLAGE